MSFMEEKIQVFQQIADGNQPVRLINNYRGIPMTSDAKIITVSQGYVTVQVYEYQAICIGLENRTYVQHECFSEVLKARPMSIDILKKEVMLTDFSGAGTTIGKRMFTRVQPKEIIDVEVYDGERRIPGRLVDISSAGLGIFTLATYIYSEVHFENDSHVMVDFRLPRVKSLIRFPGKVAVVQRQEGEYQHRLGIKLDPNPDAEALLKEYISTRQDEIMRELSILYDSIRDEKIKNNH